MTGCPAIPSLFSMKTALHTNKCRGKAVKVLAVATSMIVDADSCTCGESL